MEKKTDAAHTFSAAAPGASLRLLAPDARRVISLASLRHSRRRGRDKVAMFAAEKRGKPCHDNDSCFAKSAKPGDEIFAAAFGCPMSQLGMYSNLMDPMTVRWLAGK